MVLILIICGIIGGVLGGMGMGGGTLLIPIMTFFLGIPQQTAQCINLVAFLPMSAVALVMHFKNKLVKFREIWKIIVPALLVAVPASFLALNLRSELLGKIFGGFLIALGVYLFIDSLVAKKVKK